MAGMIRVKSIRPKPTGDKQRQHCAPPNVSEPSDCGWKPREGGRQGAKLTVQDPRPALTAPVAAAGSPGKRAVEAKQASTTDA